MLALFLANAVRAQPCGTLVIPNAIGVTDPAPLTSLNPLIGDTTYNQQNALLLYRPLVWIGQDNKRDAERSLASGIVASDGDTRFTVTLKPWLWSDGAAVTADDVVFAWERIEKLGAAFAYAGQGGIPDRFASVRALDARQVEFRLREPANPDWFTLSALPEIPALPRHAWGDIGRDELWRRQTDPSLFTVVDGPFRLARLMLDRAAVYVPNPNYGGHRAELARLVVRFTESADVLREFESGALDMAQVPPALWDRAKTLPDTQAFALPEPFGYVALVLNLRKVPAFADARVRRALADAADQKTMIALVYHGLGTENHVPVPAGADAYRSPEVRAGRLPVRADPALARAELDAAGWIPGPDGVRVKDGRRLEFSALAADLPDRVALMQILQQNLRAVGVKMRIRIVSTDAMLATLFGPPEGWDAVLNAVSQAGVPDGTTFFDTGGASNSGGYSDKDMDSLISRSTREDGLDALFAFEDLFAAEEPVIVLPQSGLGLLARTNIRGVADFLNRQGFWSPEYLSVAGCRERP